MTKEESEYIGGVQGHIHQVQQLLQRVIDELYQRGCRHDESKYSEIEMMGYMTHVPRFKHVEYMSEGYKEILKDMRETLDHHYSHNSHHPEYYKEGINNMNLIDVIEMICDWWSFSWSQDKLEEIFNWYHEHKDYIMLHPKTRKEVENILKTMAEKLLVEAIGEFMQSCMDEADSYMLSDQEV